MTTRDNSMKHTPGPWYFRPKPDDVIKNGFWIDTPTGSPIADIDFNCDVDKANARLIAAAPDMLEALKSILSRYDRVTDGQLKAIAAGELTIPLVNISAQFILDGRAALAKAEGRS